jgi:hypothetical protein
VTRRVSLQGCCCSGKCSMYCLPVDLGHAAGTGHLVVADAAASARRSHEVCG